MTVYRLRTGVVLTQICGEYALIAANAVREFCPAICQINETAAFLLRLLISGADERELERAAAEEYEIEDPAEARSAIEGFLQQMLETGYLLKEGETNE